MPPPAESPATSTELDEDSQATSSTELEPPLTPVELEQLLSACPGEQERKRLREWERERRELYLQRTTPSQSPPAEAASPSPSLHEDDSIFDYLHVAAIADPFTSPVARKKCAQLEVELDDLFGESHAPAFQKRPR